jgi:hypothetical protein
MGRSLACVTDQSAQCAMHTNGLMIALSSAEQISNHPNLADSGDRRMVDKRNANITVRQALESSSGDALSCIMRPFSIVPPLRRATGVPAATRMSNKAIVGHPSTDWTTLRHSILWICDHSRMTDKTGIPPATQAQTALSLGNWVPFIDQCQRRAHVRYALTKRARNT